ncbi:uncharacterized protein TNCV_2659881 [Trichonephila clavipes]|uniref:Mutator-like transposase domain-containing protein n=1 Tax=Trichonephila clavipes TaxID=2585209 RepID=A0A8X6UYC2_TRICX|nr:uncharacterized protein TNCV_2659881 [Trichonephila clavipes]
MNAGSFPLKAAGRWKGGKEFLRIDRYRHVSEKRMWKRDDQLKRETLLGATRLKCKVERVLCVKEEFVEWRGNLLICIKLPQRIQLADPEFSKPGKANDVSGHSDIPVAIDGTWQKHGHTSLNGAVIATSFYTDKVLNASILSRFCSNKMHNENCKANHFGNTGSMEVSRAIEIFQYSESLRYTKCLGDGNSRAYKAVNEMQPYGYTGIEKLECVGYVEKRMGTRIRALKLKVKGKKLSDKKTLDDHG